MIYATRCTVRDGSQLKHLFAQVLVLNLKMVRLINTITVQTTLKSVQCLWSDITKRLLYTFIAYRRLSC
jgi:hypothetical protein